MVVASTKYMPQWTWQPGFLDFLFFGNFASQLPWHFAVEPILKGCSSYALNPQPEAFSKRMTFEGRYWPAFVWRPIPCLLVALETGQNFSRSHVPSCCLIFVQLVYEWYAEFVHSFRTHIQYGVLYLLYGLTELLWIWWPISDFLRKLWPTVMNPGKVCSRWQKGLLTPLALPSAPQYILVRGPVQHGTPQMELKRLW